MPDLASLPGSPSGTRPGAFVAVVGPSGAGKDTILSLARPALEARGVLFARRVVTRPCDGGTEDHDCLDEEAFDRAEAAGEFCLTWRAHGLSYGLPASLRQECRGGRTVIANLSRRAIGAAAALFSRLHVVEITAPRHLLVARIAARGRESAEEIDARLARSVALVVPDGAGGPHVIDNSGAPEEAAARFAALLLSFEAATVPASV